MITNRFYSLFIQTRAHGVYGQNLYALSRMYEYSHAHATLRIVRLDHDHALLQH